MPRWTILLGFALIPVLLLGQVTVNSGTATTTPPAVPGVAPGAPLVSTPIVTFGVASPSPVGATNATANNVAGATNSTIGNVPPTANATLPLIQYSSPYPSVVGAGGEYTAGQAAAANQPSGVSTRLGVFDRGAAQFESVYAIGTPQPEISLGQLARDLRQQHAAVNARNYTNEDINRMNQQYGSPAGGTSTTAVSAGTATSGSAPATTTPPTTAQPSQPAPGQTPPPPPAQTAPPPPETMAQEQPQAATPEPQAQTGQQGQQGETQANLPNAASQMPTVLILGGAAILVGLLLRRRNQRRSGAGF